MKKIFKSVIFLFFAGMMSVNAQVNIGTDQDPLPGALLQLRENDEVTGGAANASKGLAFPRVKLSNVSQLYPMFLNDPDDPDKGETSAYKNDKATLNKEHTGLVVYNLTKNESDANRLIPGLAIWDGSHWISLTASAVGSNGSFNGDGYNYNSSNYYGNASDYASYLLASTVRVNGNYVNGQSLDTGNFIEVEVEVMNVGDYTASTTANGGIYFDASGHFDATGRQTIRLQGHGKVDIGTSSSIPLTIYLTSEAGIASCDATIPILKPVEITYAIIGTRDAISVTNTYFWSSTERTAALQSAKNFGPNGKVKIDTFTELWNKGPKGKDTATDALKQAMASGDGIPDIVLYNVYGPNVKDGHLNWLTPELSTVLAEYVNKGGCLIFGGGNDDLGLFKQVTRTNSMLKDIFGVNLDLTAQTIDPWITVIPPRVVARRLDNCYQIANNPTDSIIKGPFGNLAGKYWGEDNAANVYITKLPAKHVVQICSAKNNDDWGDLEDSYSIVWYGKTKNIFFFGDTAASCSTGGPLLTSATSDVDFPALYVDGEPQSKRYGPLLGSKDEIYNAHLELNAVAWAIHRALTNGINMNKRNSGN